MLNLKQLGNNKTELTIGTITDRGFIFDDSTNTIKRRIIIFFSYETPVAGYDHKGAFRTEEKYSKTTTKHVNEYLGGKDIGRTVSQEYINSLVS
jgi:hypothetical protein